MIKVIIVDDELLMRIGLKSMIDWEAYGFEIIGEASNGKEALELAQNQIPDLIITDIKMPLMGGIELIRESSRLLDSCQYVILSCMEEFQFVKDAMRYGAVDYLIKSDLKPQQLIEVLDIVKKNNNLSSHKDNYEMTAQYKQSVNHLKENLFKEMLSGFRKEEDIISQIDKLNIEVKQGDMIVVKLRIDQFAWIRKKYIEKDEQLLRYAVMNIMEEITPRKWNKEIIIENSAEYLLIMNTQETTDTAVPQKVLNKWFEKILGAMQDFLNISFSIGVSSIVPGFKYLKVAYQEADIALKHHFFNGKDKILYFANMDVIPTRNQHEFSIQREAEQAYKIAFESHNYQHFQELLELLRQELLDASISEKTIRKVYIRIMEWISFHFPSSPHLPDEQLTPYEQLLGQETFESIHQFTLDYLSQCIQHHRDDDHVQSYAEMAIDIIMKQYTEDISLQTVANEINVNPSYLSRIFKQETGGNFINFLTKVRIDKAKYYLKSNRFKVYEVAEKVGYHNTTYFSKIFKKVVGMSPEEYRS